MWALPTCTASLIGDQQRQHHSSTNAFPYSVATMTPGLQLTLPETFVERDFVPPQASVDPAHQREKQEMEVAQTYILQQASPTVQTLVPLCNAHGPSYTIKLDKVGSFLKPQPHMHITESSGGLQVAEIKFQVHGYDATMVYKNASISEKVALRNPQELEFELLINGKLHRWHPLGPSKSVLELTEGANRRIALFVYAEGMAQRAASTSENDVPFQEQKIGEIHVIEELLPEPVALQQILFSAAVVVEQARRGAGSIASWAAPASSKTHFSGRRRSRQEGAERI